MEYLNSDISVLPSSFPSLPPLPPSQLLLLYTIISNGLHRLSAIFQEHSLNFLFIISTTGHKKRPSQLLPPPNLQVLKVCMRHVKMHNQCNIQGLCVRVCVFHTCIMC